MRPDSGRIHKWLIKLDDDADWMLALHPVTPTEIQMESLRVARAIDIARVVKFRICTVTEKKTVCLHPEHY